MTLNQLGYFYQAAVLQHFNQAAEKMNISEPSLSRSISALEDELGVTLFEKRGRNVILTKAGEIFLEHATHVQRTRCTILPPTVGISTLPMYPLWQESIFRTLSGIFSHLSRIRISPSISIRILHP